MPPTAWFVSLIALLPGPAYAAAQGPGGNPTFSPRYDLTIQVRPDARRLAVTGTWQLPPAAAPRDSVAFLLWSRMQDVRARFVSPADLEPSILVHGGQDGDRRHTLRPARRIASGEVVVVGFDYVSDTTPAPQFRIGPRGSFAGGGGELWYPQADFQTRDVGTLRFLVPDSDVVVATGTPVMEGKGAFRFEASSPVKFAFAAGRYRVHERAGDVALRLYLLRERPGAEAILDSVAGATRVLQNWFGPHRFPRLALVEVEFGGAVLGTSEHGFILADGRQLDGEFDLPYWAHEIGHQWWGITIRTRAGTPGRMLMSEGIAEFGALLTIRQLHGDRAADAYRRGTYPGHYGRAAAEYFRLAAAGLELPVAGDPGGRTTLMHRMANTRGFLLFDQLADAVGRERFVALLARFAAEHQDDPTSYDEFREAVRGGVPPGVQGIFEQWFERTGAPLYRLEWRRERGQARGSIRQDPPGYDANVEVAVFGPGGRDTHEVAVSGPRVSFVFPAPAAVDSVILDPRHRILRWTPALRAEAEALAGYTRAEWERRFGDRDSAIAAFRTALASAPSADQDRHGVRFFLEFGLGRALSDSGGFAEARSHLEAALTAPSPRPETLPLVWVSLARASRQLGDSASFERAIREALTADGAAGGRTGAVGEVATLRAGR